MSEKIDVLSNFGLRTGEILSRLEVHRLGKVHRAIHLYLFNSNNEILLQKRALTVDSYPGVYTISVLGHVHAGETSLAAVRRELQEELGLDPSRLEIEFLFSFYQEGVLSDTFIDRQFSDVYLAYTNVDPAFIRFDPQEVSEIKFFPLAEFRAMVLNPSSGLAPVYQEECRDLIYFLGGSVKGLEGG